VIPPMDADRQEALSLKYGYPSVCLIPLTSGKVAICNGLNPRRLLTIVGREEVLPYITRMREDILAQERERELVSTDLLAELGL